MWIIPKNLHTSHFVQDTAELILDLNELSQACEQSLLVRSKPTRSRTWLAKLKRDSWMQHLFGRILRPSHSQAFAERWISSVEGSHVSHSAPPEEDKGTKTRATFGRTLFEVFESLHQEWYSLKTLKASSQANLKATNGTTQKERPFCFMSLESWNGWVIEQRREYSARQKSVHHIREKECLSLGKNWATVRTGTAKAPSGGGDPSKYLYHHRIENQVHIQVEEDKHSTVGNRQEQQAKLNPRWVDALMGLPIGWTMASCTNPLTVPPMNSDYSEMELSPTPPPEHLKSCGQGWATPTSTQRGTNLKTTLRRSIKLIRQGKQPFSTLLQVQAEASAKGLILDEVYKQMRELINQGLDSESIIDIILNEACIH